jgi:molecular chaperone GrpE
MSNDPKNPQTPGPDAVDPSANPQPNAQSPEAEDFAEIEAALSGKPFAKHHDDLIAELRRENSDLRDRALRAQADVENMRKRTEREKEDTAKYAVTRFARDMLAVADNMQRAAAAVPADAVARDPALKSLLDGVTLTDREMLNVLERHGVRKIEAQNAIFNPHFHQAVMEVENPAVPAGTCVQVFQTGYVIEDRVLRPAMVVVAKGGSASQPTPEPQDPAAAPEAPEEPPKTA